MEIKNSTAAELIRKRKAFAVSSRLAIKTPFTKTEASFCGSRKERNPEETYIRMKKQTG